MQNSFRNLAAALALPLHRFSLVLAWTLAQPSRRASLDALDAAGVPSAPVQRIDEVLADPQIRQRGMIVEQDHPVLGRIRMPNLPFRFPAATCQRAASRR